MTDAETELQERIASRAKEKNPLIQIILGPRQVGKTTAILRFLKKLKKDDYWFAAGDGVYQETWLSEQWQEAESSKKLLVIDEIQKIPNWSEVLKKKWDASRKLKHKLKCIILGSSSLDLQKGLSESLTGRFEIIRAFHWNFSETKKIKKMSFEDYLQYGGYPGSYDFIADRERWRDYMLLSIVETVISKDILLQAKVKSPALFRQCFYALATSPAQVLSYNKILGQLQDKGNIDLVKYYIDLFAGAYLVQILPKFNGSELKKKQSSPKIIPMTPALCTFHRLDNLPPDYMGRVFEALVGSQLIRAGLKVSYWSEGDFEVDFIVELKGKTIAVEVKSGAQKKSSSLQKFLKKYPDSEVKFITKENYPHFEKNPADFLK